MASAKKKRKTERSSTTAQELVECRHCNTKGFKPKFIEVKSMNREPLEEGEVLSERNKWNFHYICYECFSRRHSVNVDYSKT